MPLIIIDVVVVVVVVVVGSFVIEVRCDRFRLTFPFVTFVQYSFPSLFAVDVIIRTGNTETGV